MLKKAVSEREVKILAVLSPIFRTQVGGLANRGS